MSDPPALSHSDFLWAIGLAIVWSLVVGFIEIQRRSKSQPRACFGAPSFVYWAVLSFGNVVTTLLASLEVEKLPASLSPFFFLLLPFFGIFAFEAILKNTNVTLFNKGVLTIQDWIDKALDTAAAAAIAQEETLKEDEKDKLIEKLMELDEQEINTRVLDRMGEGMVEKLNTAAKTSSADRKRYKVFQLAAKMTPGESASILRRKKHP